MIPVVARAGPRDLLHHAWQGALAVLGIALGVAVVIAVDIANTSATRALELSIERISGRATHQIESANGRIPDETYASLTPLLAGLDATPVVEARIWIAGLGYTLLGIDPLSPRRMESAGADPSRNPDPAAIRHLLIEPGAVLMSRRDAASAGVSPGERFPVTAGGAERQALLLDMLPESGPTGSASGIVIADIATAQELGGRTRWIDRIDLAVSPEQADALAARLPPGLRLVASARRGETMERMTRSFRINLTAMSLLALLVGAFIVYNAMTFTVLRRRTLLGTLRALGCTRAQLFALVLGEALLLALLGSVLGLGLGILTGWGLLALVTGTINDLYFAIGVGRLHLSAGPMVLGLGLGVVVTLLATLAPAIEAAGAEPRDVLRPGLIERHGQRWVARLAPVGALVLVAGIVLARVESRSMLLGFAALLLAVIGFSLLVPAMLRLFAGAAAWAIASLPFARLAGTARVGALLAARGIGSSILRSGISTAALTVAVATTVGVGIMIGSFRGSLVDWLETTLQSDIYVSAPNESGERPGGRLCDAVIARVSGLDGLDLLSKGTRARVESSVGPVALLALELYGSEAGGFRIIGKQAPDLWARLSSGDLILVSEPFAYHHRVATGDSIGLFTALGWREFQIGGVFRDYGSDTGLLVIDRRTYARLWDDPTITTLGLALLPGSDPASALLRVQQAVQAGGEQVLVSANREIREQSLRIFDRTFVITRVLRLLALGVAFVGVLSALMALQLEHRREHALLRASGMTRGALAVSILVQTSLLGLAAGIFAIPLGILFGDMLITVVNLRSFGWTMELRLAGWDLFAGVLLAWSAALVAGIVPAIRTARVPPAQALRSE